MEHSDLKMPAPETVLWRYMDLTQLLDLLGNECLHFTRLDKFEDPFEGVAPLKAFENLSSKVPKNNLPEILKIRQRTHAICWHANKTESAAMWRLYLSSNEGIAIRTTAELLHKSLRLNRKVDKELFIAEVEYVDHTNESLALVNFLKWATFKRESFAHEREVRLLRVASANEIDDDFVYRAKVDINTLIESIWIGPLVPDWAAKVIKQAILKYGNFKIEHSSISKSPTYLPPSPKS